MRLTTWRMTLSSYVGFHALALTQCASRDLRFERSLPGRAALHGVHYACSRGRLGIPLAFPGEAKKKTPEGALPLLRLVHVPQVIDRYNASLTSDHILDQVVPLEMVRVQWRLDLPCASEAIISVRGAPTNIVEQVAPDGEFDLHLISPSE